MKFGHDLQKVVAVSNADWAPFFVQYKLLKKYIKRIKAEASGGPAEGRSRASTEERIGDVSAPPPPDPQGQRATLVSSRPEVAFFRKAKAELGKTEKFFREEESMLETRRGRVHEALRQLRGAAEDSGEPTGLLDDAGDQALKACLAYYRDLLLLENYAVINYCGFSKILKKHDKQTGHETRAQFMRICVAPANFTNYPKLLAMIREAEGLYQDILAAARAADLLKEPASPAAESRRASLEGLRGRPDAAPPRRGVGPDESELIDAILNLRSQTSALRAAEDDADAASPAPANAAVVAPPIPAMATGGTEHVAPPPAKRARSA